MSAVPREIRAAVYRRDGYRCVAPTLDPDCGPCRDFNGRAILSMGPMLPRELTFEHVVPGYGRMGRRAEHCVEEGVALCWGHHLGNGVKGQGGSIWATGNKHLTRAYLEELYR